MSENTQKYESADKAAGDRTPASRDDQKGRPNRDNRGNRVQESD